MMLGQIVKVWIIKGLLDQVAKIFRNRTKTFSDHSTFPYLEAECRIRLQINELKTEIAVRFFN